MVKHIIVFVILLSLIMLTGWTEEEKKAFLDSCKEATEQQGVLDREQAEIYCNCTLQEFIIIFPNQPPSIDEITPETVQEVYGTCINISFNNSSGLEKEALIEQSQQAIMPTTPNNASQKPRISAEELLAPYQDRFPTPPNTRRERAEALLKEMGFEPRPDVAEPPPKTGVNGITPNQRQQWREMIGAIPSTEGNVVERRMEERNSLFILIFIIGMLPAVGLRLLLKKYDTQIPKAGVVVIGAFVYIIAMVIVELANLGAGNPSILAATIASVSIFVLWGSGSSTTENQELTKNLVQNDTSVQPDNQNNTENPDGDYKTNDLGSEKSEINNTAIKTTTLQIESNSTAVENDSDSDLRGVGGWLNIFCFLLVIVNPLLMISGIIQSWDDTDLIFEFYPIFEDVLRIDATITVGIMIYGFIVAVMIYGGSNKGKELAELYLKIRFALFIIVALVSYGLLSSIPELHQELIEGTIISIAGEAVFFGVWFSYFKTSKRVANTYSNGELLTDPAKEKETEMPHKESFIKPVVKHVESNSEQKKILQIQIRDELISFEFVLQPNKTIIYSNDTLTKNEAKEIAEKLNERYPRLKFEVKDISDQDDPFAPIQIGIIGVIKNKL